MKLIFSKTTLTKVLAIITVTVQTNNANFTIFNWSHNLVLHISNNHDNITLTYLVALNQSSLYKHFLLPTSADNAFTNTTNSRKSCQGKRLKT